MIKVKVLVVVVLWKLGGGRSHRGVFGGLDRRWGWSLAGAEVSSTCVNSSYLNYSATSPVAHLDRLTLGKRYDFPFQYNLGGGREAG